jgi:2-dehydro-3-deoxyphosphogluconate aldolase/(4S)-4-hydroxy-2-oxoglutarate aldolase
MSVKKSVFERLQKEMIVAVVREESSSDGWNVAQTYARHGLGIIEITLTTPDAITLIERVAAEFPRVVVAAGTVRNGNDAATARRAGASMLVSPHTDLRVLDYATEHDLFCVAGAGTATEVIRAWEAGAVVVKIYPALHLGGPEFIRTLRQPIRDVPMLAGGPVPLESMDAYYDAGCLAVNLGGSLAVESLVSAKAWDQIGVRVERARKSVASRLGVHDTDSLPVH